MIPYQGEIAALITAFCWSWTAIFFTIASKRVGFTSVNLLRLTGAVVLLYLTARLMLPGSIMSWYSGGKIGYIALSGVIGLAIGDNALFAAMIRFGPRRATLIMACVPIITALLALGVLNEHLPLTAWIGIIITMVGVAWVVLEKSTGEDGSSPVPGEGKWQGIWLGLLAAVCQAVGLILAKSGMGEAVDPVAATLLRMVAGLSGIVLLVLFKGDFRGLRVAFRDRKALVLIGGGTLVGPFIGVWLSLVAVRFTEAGIAATLMGLTPLIVIPWSFLIFKERVSARVWIGTVGAVLGTALIFQR